MTKGPETSYLLLAAGSLMVALSGTLVGKYAFESNVAGVFLGYTLFVVAYKTCWYGAQQEGNISDTIKGVREFSGRNLLEEKPWRYLMILLGVYLAAHGTTEFAGVVAEPEVLDGIEAGISTFGGYILAHEGVNEVPI